MSGGQEIRDLVLSFPVENEGERWTVCGQEMERWTVCGQEMEKWTVCGQEWRSGLSVDKK